MMENKLKVLGVCHPDWRGIKAATRSLTADIFEVAEISSASQATEVATKLLERQPEKVVLSGYPRGYDLLAEAIKNIAPKTRVFFWSHAPFTWYHGRAEEVAWFERMLEAYRSGFIEKIGFAKKDPAVFFGERDINTFFVMGRPPKPKISGHVPDRGRPQIGVWGSEMWHRNLLNQVLGGLMVKEATVHVNELSKYFFLDDNRIKRNGILPREAFEPLLDSMDVNLYVSFTDCFPMTVVESMSRGIPCLVSDTSEVYAWSGYLADRLIMSKIDSPVAIRDRIVQVLENYVEIQRAMAEYLPVLDGEIERSIQKFLE